MPRHLVRDRIASHLRTGGPWQTRHIAAELGLGLPTTSTNLTRLEREGLAIRIRSGLWTSPESGVIPIAVAQPRGRIKSLEGAIKSYPTGDIRNGRLARRILDLLAQPRDLPEMTRLLEVYCYEAVRQKTQQLVDSGHVVRTLTVRKGLNYHFRRSDVAGPEAFRIDISTAQARALSALSPGTYVERAELCRTASLERAELVRLQRAGLVRIVRAGPMVAVRLTATGRADPRRNPDATKAPRLLDSLADGRCALPLMLALGPVASSDLEKLRREGYWTSASGICAGLVLNNMNRASLVRKSGPARKKQLWQLTPGGRSLARLTATQMPRWTPRELREVIARTPHCTRRQLPARHPARAAA